MIPVSIGRLNKDDDEQTGVIAGFMPDEVIEDPDSDILVAYTEEGIPVGTMALVTEGDDLRIEWMEVPSGLRGNGIGSVMIQALTGVMEGDENGPGLIVWFDASNEGFRAFLDHTGVFELDDEYDYIYEENDQGEEDGIRIAVWNRDTVTGLEAAAADEEFLPEESSGGYEYAEEYDTEFMELFDEASVLNDSEE